MSFCSRFFCKSCPSTSATFSPLVTGDACRPASKLKPAGPPPTQTTSYISGASAEVEADLREGNVRIRKVGLESALLGAPNISRGGIASLRVAGASSLGLNGRIAEPQIMVSWRGWSLACLQIGPALETSDDLRDDASGPLQLKSFCPTPRFSSSLLNRESYPPYRVLRTNTSPRNPLPPLVLDAASPGSGW